MSPDLQPEIGAVGPRLRELRQQRDVTLTDLAAATGISVSTLSRLESGQRRPTLELLWPLARVHGVTLDDLVDAPGTGDPRVHLRPVKRGNRTLIALTNRPGGLRAYKQVIPGQKRHLRQPELGTHEGYEWLYVLDGALRLMLGDQDLVLHAGEVAEFDTRTPHGMWSATPAPVEILCLFGPQGERAHVRALTGEAD